MDTPCMMQGRRGYLSSKTMLNCRECPKLCTVITLPSRVLLSAFLAFILIATSCPPFINYAKAKSINVHSHRRQVTIEPTPSFPQNLDQTVADHLAGSISWRSDLLSSIHDNTPALESITKDNLRLGSNRDLEAGFLDPEERRPIYPHEVFRRQSSAEVDASLFSPIFEHSSEIFEHRNQQERHAQFGLETDSKNNLLDLIESGSGNSWEQPSDDPPLNSEIIPTPRILGDRTQQTPLFEPHSNEQSSVSIRDLPILVATAGQVWRYTIPSDTFEDLEGSMRRFQSNLEYQTDREKQTTYEPFDPYVHWLQYDSFSQTLFGCPTSADVGEHRYKIYVSDDWGRKSTLDVVVLVRLHSSIRAFSHSFSLVNIVWDREKYTSLSKALIDIIDRVTERIYHEPTSKNLVLHSYNFPNQSSTLGPIGRSLSPITIVWSNASVPVYPCNSSHLDRLLKPLIEEQFAQSPQDDTSSFSPSQELKKVLAPEFSISRIDFSLHGSCGNGFESSSSTNDSVNFEPLVRTRIQRLQWRLGQPFVFKIPDDTFIAEAGSKNASGLTLTIHTVDGLPLENDPLYSYMEFDQDRRILYGFPYDFEFHSGPKELLLTAKNPNTSSRAARDVIVIDIVKPELTSINNRAFNMSLFFISRQNSFGPQSRVDLSEKIIRSLGVADGALHTPNLNAPEFVVIEMGKFQIDMPPNAIIDQTNSWAYNDKIRHVDDILGTDFRENQSGNSERTVVYKLTWTNESIGFRGDCPVEVITENVVGALEREIFSPYDVDDSQNKNASVIFYEKLRSYFNPEIDLVFLSIGPMEGSACMNSLIYYDVGNSDLAELINLSDSPEDSLIVQDTTNHLSPSYLPGAPIRDLKTTRPMINSDEYWSIVVLIILVVALIFVVMMFFMGMHTYRINQEKRFELQVKLAQARQNSMYLSSIMLADPAAQQNYPNQQFGTINARHRLVGEPALRDDGSVRKSIILDNEKNLWANGNGAMTMYKPTAVQLRGQSVQTTPLGPNMTFTLDSIAAMQNTIQNGVGAIRHREMMLPNRALMDDKKRSMTLNRRPTTESQQSRMIARQTSVNNLNHSQSILTVASLAGPVQFMPHQGVANMPILYTPLPVVGENHDEMTSRES